MTEEEWEKLREVVLENMRPIPPPPNCWLKEFSPGMFAWVECADDGDDNDTTE